MERKCNMSDKKLFDIHIEVGDEGGSFYARTVVANLEFKHNATNVVYDAISMVLNDLISNGVLNSLVRDPSMASYPIPTPIHSHTMVVVGPMRGHSHGNSIASPHPIFELHFEFGVGSGGKGYYAKTQFMKPFIEYRKFRNQFIEDTANDLLLELEDQGVLLQLLMDPQMSSFPFLSPSSSTVSAPTPAAAKKVDFKRELPSACIGYADIECRDHCTSWDCFGAKKCGNMCSWRKKI